MQPTHHPALTMPGITSTVDVHHEIGRCRRPVGVAATLASAAAYLRRHGWIQGSYYDQSATVYTPAACVVGALAIVCYGGPVDTPTQLFDQPGFAEFEAAFTHLDAILVGVFGQDVFTWNDDRRRSYGQVLAVLDEIAATSRWLDSMVDGAR